MAAKKKMTKAPKAKDEAKKAASRAKAESPSNIGKSISGDQRVSRKTAQIARRNSQGGKLTAKDKIMLGRVVQGSVAGRPSFKSDEEYMAAKIIQSRRGGETSRTASRAKAMAKKEAKANKAARARRALGN